MNKINFFVTICIVCALSIVSIMNAQKKGKSVTQFEKATFGAGCFWCTEAVFSRLPGVQSVVVGYAGGTVPKPTYEQVCSGTTGHAEVSQITFDPAKVTYEKLLETLWEAHDPTTLNQQGADHGTQYRSVIFYSDEKQKVTAEKSQKDAQKNFSDPIVTELKPLTVFYAAENYHQDYYDNNKNASYCRFVIKPKLDKLKIGNPSLREK